MIEKKGEKFFTLKEVSEMVNFTIQWLLYQIKKGKVKAVSINKPVIHISEKEIKNIKKINWR